MSKKKRSLDILSAIADDLIESATAMRIKLLKRIKRGSYTKRIVAIGSLAAAIFIVCSAVFLLGIGRNLPVYTGMTVSSDKYGANASAYEIAQNLPDLLSVQGLSRLDVPGNVNGNAQGRPFETNATTAATEHDFAPKPAANTFYAKRGEDFYITVHIDNPDNYEILSFTLNGVKYSSYMFEAGSDMENLILKCNAGDAEGIVEYTIDAIKYVDGIMIRNVIIGGEKTVRVGLYDEFAPSVSMKNIKKTYTGISFDVSLGGDTSIFSYENGTVYAVIERGGTEISRSEIALSDEIGISFTGLLQDTEYTVKFVASVDVADGAGIREYPMYEYKFTTLQTKAPELNVNISPKKTAIGCTASLNNPCSTGKLEKMELYFGGKCVGESENFSDCIFSGLTLLETYKLRIYYSYDLFDGKGAVTKYKEYTVGTQSEGLAINWGEGTSSDTSFIYGIGTCKDTVLYINMTVMDVAFSENKNIKSVVVGKDAELLGSPFWYCENLESVVYKEGVTLLGKYAFPGCINLKSVTIPSSVETISEGAFWGSGIESINIPNGVTKIEERAFLNCPNLKSIVIPNTVTEIGEAAFYGCKNLNNVVIPSSVKKIGASAFGACDLYALYIPSSVIEVGDQYAGYLFNMPWETGNFDFYIYTDASSLPNGWAESMLNKVVFDISHMQNEGDFVYAIMKNGAKSVACYIGTAESVEISADVVYVFDCAFVHMEQVREIVLKSKNTVIFMMSYDWVYDEKNIRIEENE